MMSLFCLPKIALVAIFNTRAIPLHENLFSNVNLHDLPKTRTKRKVRENIKKGFSNMLFFDGSKIFAFVIHNLIPQQEPKISFFQISQ